MSRKIANTDTTYCTKKCKNKCWRHVDNYQFDDDTLYWFTETCIERGEIQDGKQSN